MVSEKEMLGSSVNLMVELADLLERQGSQIEVAARALGTSTQDGANSFLRLFVIKTVSHYSDNLRFFAREIEGHSEDAFYLMPVLRTQLEMFTLLMSLRHTALQEQVSMLLTENFVQIVQSYKKDRSSGWGIAYNDAYKLYRSIIDEFELKIPPNIEAMSNRVIKELPYRLRPTTEMYDDLQDKVKDLLTTKDYPAQQLNIIYSHLCRYAHGNAFFIGRVNREDIWIISCSIYFSLFISEMMDRDYLAQQNIDQFTKTLESARELKQPLLEIWQNRK